MIAAFEGAVPITPGMAESLDMGTPFLFVFCLTGVLLHFGGRAG